jgi:TetR/AcrR family transcriptional regulator, regulator of autoinduction and epiphytic fitness
MTTAPVTDGRSARSQRTRSAVVDALLDLLRGGNLRPTAREIAERAGVSLRSVYVHFDDLDDLFLAAARRQMELIAPIVVEVPATGPLAERADSMMEVRGRFYEQIGPVRRAAEIQEPFSPPLAVHLQSVRDAGRADLRRVFAAELDALAVDDRARRLALLEVITGAAAWDHLREASGMDVNEAQSTISAAIVDMLESPR